MTQRMVELGIIAPVTTQTDWVSSFVSVQKPGKVRICIDPPYLNAALKRSHHVQYAQRSLSLASKVLWYSIGPRRMATPHARDHRGSTRYQSYCRFFLVVGYGKHVQPLFKTTIRISKNFLLVLVTKASSLIWKRSVFVCEKSNLLDIPSQVKESNLIRRKLTLFLTCILPKMLKQSDVF